MAAVQILLVEADSALVRQLNAALAQQGWGVVAAADAIVAQTLARQHKFSVAIVDEKLPGGGGVRVLQRLRSIVNTALTPAVALAESRTSHGELMRAGAQECLTKPVAPETVMQAVRRALGIALAPTMAPEHVLQDPARLQSLRATGMLDAPRDTTLDLLTRLTSTLTKAPTALLSLVDVDRQFFASEVGLAEPWRAKRETPMSLSFCQWTVASGDPLIVENAREHPLLKHNVAVDQLGVGAYAGMPVFGPDQQVVGSFCVVDSKYRAWTPQQLAILTDMADIARVEVAQRSPEGATVPQFARSIGASLRLLATSGPTLAAADRDALLGVAQSHVQRLEALAVPQP